MIKSQTEKHQKTKEASISHQSVKLHAGKEEGGEVLVFQTGMKTKSFSSRITLEIPPKL